jgi:hypothetical protein
MKTWLVKLPSTGASYVMRSNDAQTLYEHFVHRYSLPMRKYTVPVRTDGEPLTKSRVADDEDFYVYYDWFEQSDVEIKLLGAT